MSASAVAAGCVDFVLPPAAIAKELVALAGRPLGAEVPVVPSSSKTRGEERAFEEILALLRQRVGVDFVYYKRQTIERRIQRRMALQRLTGSGNTPTTCVAIFRRCRSCSTTS